MSEPELTPIGSIGFFTVYPNGEIFQAVEYRYYEKKGYYRGVLESRELLEREKKILRRGMENILSEERVLINGQEVSWRVFEPDILLPDYQYPVIVFHISMPFSIMKGRNIYEEYYEEAIAEYSYTAYWYFPRCMQALNVEASGQVRVSDNNRLVVIKVSKGDHIEGYESLLFENKCRLCLTSV
ncbi:MAG: hypothetical protein F7B59_04655 [Desulfurococcales archaeon]|nr:hypothetical protein [Desulfurococcales archaeon]